MASILFPPNLPKPVVDAYSLRPRSSNVSSDFEAGPRRVRNQYKTPTYDFSLRWTLTESELGVFEYFIKNVSQWGSIWFDLTILNGNGLRRVEARIPSGSYDCSTISSNYFSVSMEIEARSMTYIDEADYIAATQTLFYNSAVTYNGAQTHNGFKD